MPRDSQGKEYTAPSSKPTTVGTQVKIPQAGGGHTTGRMGSGNIVVPDRR